MRKRFAVVALLLTLTLSACGTDTAVTDAPVETEGVAVPDASSVAVSRVMEERGVLRMLDYYPLEPFEEALAIFKRKFPGWTVETLEALVETREEILADGSVITLNEFEGNETSEMINHLINVEADLVSINTSYTNQFERPELLADLRDYFQSDPEAGLNRLLPTIRELMAYEGGLPLVPLWFDTYGLMPRGDIVLMAGRDIPEPWTWQTASDWFDEDAKVNGSEMLLADNAQFFLARLISENNAYFYNPQTGYIDFTSPLLKEIYSTVKWLYDNKRLNGINENDPETVERITAAREVALLDYGSIGEDALAFPSPVIPGATGRAAMLNIVYGINAASSESQKQAAWEFIKILLSDEIQNGEMLDSYSWASPVITELSKEGMAKVSGWDADADITDEELAMFNAARLERSLDIDHINYGMDDNLRFIVYRDSVENFLRGNSSVEQMLGFIKRDYEALFAITD